jgi:hypothetical protein
MPEVDPASLIQKHRARGVLVDSNLLVLLLVGLVNKRRILQFKRTQSFTAQDFELLRNLISVLGTLIATPHVLAQLSDLAALPGKELRIIRQLFRSIVHQIEEPYDPSRVLVEDPLFERLGLTDAAIAMASSRGILVLTADLQLYLSLLHRGADALNFNYIRQSAWS